MKIIFTKLVIAIAFGMSVASLSASDQNNSTGGVSIPGDQSKLECCNPPSPQK